MSAGSPVAPSLWGVGLELRREGLDVLLLGLGVSASVLPISRLFVLEHSAHVVDRVAVLTLLFYRLPSNVVRLLCEFGAGGRQCSKSQSPPKNYWRTFVFDDVDRVRDGEHCQQNEQHK